MNNQSFQIFGLDEVNERAKLSPGVKGIHIYNGHINESTGKSVLTMYIKRDPGGNWPAEQMAYINKLKGNFTVVLKPSNEFFYISSYEAQNTAPNLFNSLNGSNEGLLDLVNKITALEAEKIALIARVNELQDDLKQFETAGDKFSYALEQLFYKVAPTFGLMPKIDQPLNGTNMNNNWQQQPLTNELNEPSIENALEVIYGAFGEEWLIKFAAKIQQQPSLVNQLKTML